MVAFFHIAVQSLKILKVDHLGFSTSNICQKAVKKGASDQLGKEGFLEDYCNRIHTIEIGINIGLLEREVSFRRDIGPGTR